MSISMAMPELSSSDYAAVGVVVILHALGLWALMQYAPARAAVSETATLMFSLVKPETPPEPPKIILPEPRPKLVMKPKPQPERLAAKTPLPTPVEEVYVPPPEPDLKPVAIDAPPPPPAPPASVTVPPPVLQITPPETSADYANNPLPQYPVISRRLGEAGRLQVRVCVSVDGTVLSATVNKSSGSERLDRATVDALKQWRFKPAHRGNEPVPGCVAVPWTWSLNS